jgi:hypothetical protein
MDRCDLAEPTETALRLELKGWPRMISTPKNNAVSAKAINTIRTSGFMPGKTTRGR